MKLDRRILAQLADRSCTAFEVSFWIATPLPDVQRRLEHLEGEGKVRQMPPRPDGTERLSQWAIV